LPSAFPKWYRHSMGMTVWKNAFPVTRAESANRKRPRKGKITRKEGKTSSKGRFSRGAGRRKSRVLHSNRRKEEEAKEGLG